LKITDANNKKKFDLGTVLGPQNKVLYYFLLIPDYISLGSVEDPGCFSGSWIRFFPSRIPDQNFFHLGSASKNLSILTPKMVSKL
jgi:hypothetical protein